MVNWKYKISGFHIILNDESTSLTTKYELISKLFHKDIPERLWKDGVLSDIMFVFKMAGEQDNMDDFDYGLEKLYDFCDDNLIWLGLEI